MQQEQFNLLPTRGEKRIQVALPIRVTSWNGDAKSRLEMACTYDISKRGARVTGLQCVKGVGEILTIQRGINKALYRVVWVSEDYSQLRGQVGIQCVDMDKRLWDAEFRELEGQYDPIGREHPLPRTNSRLDTRPSDRRSQQRLPLEGRVELQVIGAQAEALEAELKNISEFGCLISTGNLLVPGSDVKLIVNLANQALSFKGLVRHADPKLELGIEFCGIRKGDRQLLKYLLRRLADQNKAGSSDNHSEFESMTTIG
jgi:PilZ domain